MGPVTQDTANALQTTNRPTSSGRVLHVGKPNWTSQAAAISKNLADRPNFRADAKPFAQAMQQAAPAAKQPAPVSVQAPTQASALSAGTSATSAAAPAPQSAPAKFAPTAAPAQTAAATPPALGDIQIKRGDTLIGVVQQAAASQGKTVNGAQAWQMAQQLASSNGIDDPNLIHPGQRLKTNALGGMLAALPNKAGVHTAGNATPVVSTQAALALRMTNTLSAKSINMLQGTGHNAAAMAGGLVSHIQPAQQRRLMNTPVLDKTLQRAVDKGFMSAVEVPHVQQKIVSLAHKHKFSPDDFARLTLMESDGMNPKASNGSCHGIIQFCDGDDRGAASVGFANNPRAILNMSTYKQLDLVDKYFEEVGVGKNGPVRLDDLYLSVLTPAARQENRRHVPLDIAGTQATYLHVGKDRGKPITRQSIWAGLHANANQRLRDVEVSPAITVGRGTRVSAYNAAQGLVSR